MRNSIFALAICVSLAGCASAPNPAQFQTSVNNTVQDVAITTKGAVSIVADILTAVMNIGQPIVSILASFGVKAL